MKNKNRLIALITIFCLLVIVFAWGAFGSTEPEAAKVKAPYIVNDVMGENRCYPNDPLGPCHDRLLLIKNPGPKKVWVVVGCGLEVQSSIEASIAPRKSVVFQVSSSENPGGLQLGQCQIVKWFTM